MITPRQLSVLFILAAFLSCSEKALMRRRVRNTINACGFIADTARIFKSTRSELSIYDLSPKESVAEVGFGTGWLTGVILLRCDSLSYYANDVDEAALTAIGQVTEKYLSLRQRPNTNKLVVVRGSVTRTNLPHGLFDKVIVRETFHHFEFPGEMLQDLRGLLKPSGRLYVYEPAPEKTFFSRDCGTNIPSKTDLLAFFTARQFSLEAEHDLFDSPGNVPSWYEKDPKKITPKKVFVFRKM